MFFTRFTPSLTSSLALAHSLTISPPLSLLPPLSLSHSHFKGRNADRPETRRQRQMYMGDPGGGRRARGQAPPLVRLALQHRLVHDEWHRVAEYDGGGCYTRGLKAKATDEINPVD